MKRNLLCLLIAVFAACTALDAQWIEARFESEIPEGATKAGQDGNGPIYIAKVTHNGTTYIAKMGKNSTGVTVPNGDSKIKLTSGRYEVYSGPIQWESVENGSVPDNAFVLSGTSRGDLYLVKLKSINHLTSLGWLRPGQPEAEYLLGGKIYSTSAYQVLVGTAASPAGVAVSGNEQPRDAATNDTPPQPPASKPNKPSVVVAPGGQNNRSASRGNTNTGGISLVFVQENSLAVDARRTYVQVILRNEDTGSVMKKVLEESPGRGEMPLRDLVPGRYTATIEASYEENNSGNREGWSTPVRLNVAPNPLSFTIRPGVVSTERVLVSKPK